MKKIVLGIVAHVDSGKTTLSESLLYLSGAIRKLGRVDHKDAFLDTYELEKARGITIFSKQANFVVGETNFTLLDTPGHIDFSAEMERTLQVLDYAILVISGPDGIQGHTKTLWNLLEKYNIPVFIFINKMDHDGTDKATILKLVQQELNGQCVEFDHDDQLEHRNCNEFYESIATCDEAALDEYFEDGQVTPKTITRLISQRKLFPCYFGSALKLTGIKEFLYGISYYTKDPCYGNQFGGKVYKIARDSQGNRLTYLKITGGSLKIRDTVDDSNEKINQIRIYSGSKYELVNEVHAGFVCAVSGLTHTKPGDGLGIETTSSNPFLQPVLTYQVVFLQNVNPLLILPKFQQLEEEIPELHIVWQEDSKSIQAQIMGEVQIEIIKSIAKERFELDIDFSAGQIVYKETIRSKVEGIGHFEPLRHYAEVHLLLEPLERGAGLEFASDCSEDILDRNWQRLIMTHLEEKEHRGVLTGSTITDMRITLVTGRAHQKHTEGGDFREATYRAIRQGLKKAESVLLEPYYNFLIEIPENCVGRAMMDLEKMGSKYEVMQSHNGIVQVKGRAAVQQIQHYQTQVIAYTKGFGKISLEFGGYDECQNADEVVVAIGYDSERDITNPTNSVFCAHGAGFIVPWYEVEQYMHLESIYESESKNQQMQLESKMKQRSDDFIDLDEIDTILEKTFYANRRSSSESFDRKRTVKRQEIDSVPRTRSYHREKQDAYLLIDGYNVIYANEETKEIALENLEAACHKLMDIVCDYQAMMGCQVLLVFDAYKVIGHSTEIIDYHNIKVVYTKEAETADQFIEKFAHLNADKFQITVATSDAVEQIIIRSKGCNLLSARDFWLEIYRMKEKVREEFLDHQKSEKNYLFDSIDKDKLKQISNKED